jgi:hypothetical protein
LGLQPLCPWDMNFLDVSIKESSNTFEKKYLNSWAIKKAESVNCIQQVRNA